MTQRTLERWIRAVALFVTAACTDATPNATIGATGTTDGGPDTGTLFDAQEADLLADFTDASGSADGPLEIAATLKVCDDPQNRPTCDSKNAKCVAGAPGKDATCVCNAGLTGDPYVEGGCSANVLECALQTDECDDVSTNCVEMNPLDPQNINGVGYVCECRKAKGFSIPAPPFGCDCPAGKAVLGDACVCKPGTEDDGAGGCKASCAGGCGTAECGVDKCGNSCGICKANSTCDVNTCKCNLGYEIDVTSGACRLKNVCGTPEQTKPCPANASCVPVSPGVSTCTCAVGYAEDAGNCVLKDKCTAGNGGCAPDANCYMEPTTGVVSCSCKPGYEGDGKSCSNINECLNGTSGCDANAICKDLPGSNACVCKPGWSGDGLLCVEIDECAAKTADCDPNAKCHNTEGSYTCTCKDGFSGDGKSCADIDECKTPGICGSNAKCTNTPGSYDCGCGPGYTGVPPSCTDVNECAKGTDNCDVNADCVNTVGGFTCTCKAGFKGDGVTCSDVLECQSNNGGCDGNATCTEQVGLPPICECIPGFNGDGRGCAVAYVDIAFYGAVIATQPIGGGCWDSGCTPPSPQQLKAINDAVATAAGALASTLVSPLVGQIVSEATKAINVVQVISDAMADKTSKPDPDGTITLFPGLITKQIPNGGAAEDTFMPIWNGVLWQKVKLDSNVKLSVYLEDDDWDADDPIGSAEVTHKGLVAALEATGVFYVPATNDPSKSNIHFIKLGVSKSYECGNGQCESGEAMVCVPDCGGPLCNNSKCEAGETITTCPWDCKSSNGPVCGDGNCTTGETVANCPADCGASNPGSCEGVCGGESPDGCYCDVECVENGDCCSDVDDACPIGCENKCGSSVPSMDFDNGVCYCDGLCASSGDCCSDKNTYCK